MTNASAQFAVNHSAKVQLGHRDDWKEWKLSIFFYIILLQSRNGSTNLKKLWRLVNYTATNRRRKISDE